MAIQQGSESFSLSNQESPSKKSIAPTPSVPLSERFHNTTLSEDRMILISLKRLIWFGAFLFAIAIFANAKGWISSTIITLVPSSMIELVSGSLLAVYKLVSEKSEKALAKITEREQLELILLELNKYPEEFREQQFSKIIDKCYSSQNK